MDKIDRSEIERRMDVRGLPIEIHMIVDYLDGLLEIMESDRRSRDEAFAVVASEFGRLEEKVNGLLEREKERRFDQSLSQSEAFGDYSPEYMRRKRENAKKAIALAKMTETAGPSEPRYTVAELREKLKESDKDWAKYLKRPSYSIAKGDWPFRSAEWFLDWLQNQ